MVDGGEGQPDGPLVPGQEVEEAVDDPGGVADQKHHHNCQQRLGGPGILVVRSEQVACDPVRPVDVQNDRSIEEEEQGHGDGRHDDHFGPQVVTHLVGVALGVFGVVIAAWSRVVMLKGQTVTVSGIPRCVAALQEEGQVEGDADDNYRENVGPGLVPGGTAEARLEGVTRSA